MSRPQLTKEIAYTALQNFFLNKPFVLYATGTSCAVDIGFGMAALENYLKSEIPKCTLSAQQEIEWQNVIEKLADNPDFEMAMNSIQDETLLSLIIENTAEHVSSIDRKHCTRILDEIETWPAISLFKRLVDRLPEMDRTLHVATPNYDMLAEYAFTQAEIPYTTGFWGGVVRKLNWKQATRQMTYAEKVSAGRSKYQSVTRYKKHIHLYKVHGSLNTFLFNQQVVETDAWHSIPDTAERLMITPGTAKHEKLHEYRDALLAKFDEAVSTHNAFLFLGFGFNDTQLVKNAIDVKLRNQNSPSLIINRDTNDRIGDLLKSSKNTWLVCKNECNDSTRIFNNQYNDWLELPDVEIWKFDTFTKEILGG